MSSVTPPPPAAPPSLLCPLSQEPFDTPVILACNGITYSRHAIESHLKATFTDPSTHCLITTQSAAQLLPNVALEEALMSLRRRNSDPGIGESSSSNVVVPQCAITKAQEAAFRKDSSTIAQLRLLHRPAVPGFSSSTINNLTSVPVPTEGYYYDTTNNTMVATGHHNSQIPTASPLPVALDRIQLTESPSRGTVMEEMSPSGRHVITREFEGCSFGYVVGGSGGKAGSSLSTSGTLTTIVSGAREESLSHQTDETIRNKITACCAANDFPDFCVSAGNEKVVRIWRRRIQDTAPETSPASSPTTSPRERSKSWFGALQESVVGGFLGGKKGSPRASTRKMQSSDPPQPSLATSISPATSTDAPLVRPRWMQTTAIKTKEWISCLSCVNNGTMILGGTRKGTLCVWKGDNPLGVDWKCSEFMTNDRQLGINAVDWDITNQNNVVSVGDEVGVVRVWEMQREFVMGCRTSLICPSGQIGLSVKLNLVGSAVLWGGSTGRTACFDVATGENTFKADDEDEEDIIQVEWGGGCSELIYNCSSRGKVLLFDVRAGGCSPVKTLEGVGGSCVGMAVNDFGDVCILGSDGATRTWDKRGGGWMMQQIMVAGVKPSCIAKVGLCKETKQRVEEVGFR